MATNESPRFAQVFGKDEVMVTDAERDRAKVVCLGIIYGKASTRLL